MRNNRRRSVLIAENNREVAQEFRTHLEHAGFSVFVARDGEQACILAARQRFELIITNLELPVMSGADFCRHVREDLGLSDVTIAVCTTNSLQSQTSALVIKYGVAHVFFKPINHESVVEFACETVGSFAVA